ncbi:MAG: hypothetical protein IPI58_03075 [Alphaproteobacteria bacterium]|nr:MAG: hypothetical protein IPI58_03075 [Alphaproteobacteria bacterium]
MSKGMKEKINIFFRSPYTGLAIFMVAASLFVSLFYFFGNEAIGAIQIIFLLLLILTVPIILIYLVIRNINNGISLFDSIKLGFLHSIKIFFKWFLKII